MTPARVVLADNHTMFREGIASVIASRGSVEVGQASHGRDAVALVERLKPDVVITQVEHHPKRAEEIHSKVRSASPSSFAASPTARWLQSCTSRRRPSSATSPTSTRR